MNSAGNTYQITGKPVKKTILLLFIFSLIIRIAFVVPFALYDIPLMTDEIEYFDFSIGYMNILEGLAHGDMPSSENILRAYGDGQWPPLNSFLLGLVFFLFGKKIIIARILLAMLSAVTTVLVYLLTLRISSQKAAAFASLIHIFYVSFIGYSHYLLSETLYIFLLLLSVYFTFLAHDAESDQKKIINAVFSGLGLGLCGLTRPSILPFLVIIPFWHLIFSKGFKNRVLLPAVIMISYILVLSPWQAYLVTRSDNPGVLTNINGWYLHIGNNPWVPDGYGSSWQHDSRGPMVDSAWDYSKKHPGTGFDQSQKILATEVIKTDLKKFLIRGVYKMRMFWSMDFFVLMHLFYAAYPPLPLPVAAFIWGTVLISYLLLMIIIAYGLLTKAASPAKKILILLLVPGAMAPSFVAFGISRFHLPLLALLLPFAGHGLAGLKNPFSLPRKILLLLFAALIIVSTLTSLPLILQTYLKPSSHYCSLISTADKILGSSTDCVDKIVFRSANAEIADELLITAESSGYGMNITQKDMWTRVPPSKQISWKVSEPLLRLDVYAKNISSHLSMKIYSSNQNKSVLIEPIKADAWRAWQPSGIEGIEYLWLGGGMGIRNKLPEDKLFQFQ